MSLIEKKHTKTSSQFNSTIELMDDPITTRFSIMCYKFFSSKKSYYFKADSLLFCFLQVVWMAIDLRFGICSTAGDIYVGKLPSLHAIRKQQKPNFVTLTFWTQKKLRVSVFNRYTFIDFILLFFNNFTVSVVVLKFFNYWKTSIINGFWYKITDRNVYSLRRCLLYIHIIYQ